MVRLICYFFAAVLTITSCEQSTISSIFSTQFTSLDKDSNSIGIAVHLDYQRTEFYENYLQRRYGLHYGDSILLPVIRQVSNRILINYSAGEIYNYDRAAIEKAIGNNIRRELAKINLEMKSLNIYSVELSDTLMRQLREQHDKRLKAKP